LLTDNLGTSTEFTDKCDFMVIQPSLYKTAIFWDMMCCFVDI